MTSTEKLITLIDKGDPVPILAEDSLVESFNELLKYGLIDIVNDRVILTAKGIEAKHKGLNQVLYDLNVQEELKEFSKDAQKKENILFRWSLGLCLSLTAFFLAISLTNCV